ncbi:Uncharacterised protein [uncultured archaeon]|nr:Uncharacterised protein [uncultured archaeon]
MAKNFVHCRDLYNMLPEFFVSFINEIGYIRILVRTLLGEFIL